MASGSFITNTYFDEDGENYSRYIEVVWQSTNDTSQNTSFITWTAYARSTGSSFTTYILARDITVTFKRPSGIDATEVFFADESHGLYKDEEIGSGECIIRHEDDGTLTVPVEISAKIYYTYAEDPNCTCSDSIDMTPNPVYDLNITASAGVTVDVNRTKCRDASMTGSVAGGAKKLYSGDSLIISANSYGGVKTDMEVNGSPFTSGETYSVNGNVNIICTATGGPSTIFATDTHTGGKSSVTITKTNNDYYHTISYSLSGASDAYGWVDASGNVSDSVVKFQDTSFQFQIPPEFDNLIAEGTMRLCTLVCKTYQDGTTGALVGTTIGIFYVTHLSAEKIPTVSGEVTDSNIVSAELTGDNTKLIRYKSTAHCVIDATPAEGSIERWYVNEAVVNDGSNYCNIPDTEYDTYVFTAVQTNGLSGTDTVTADVIPYVKLTCNASVQRIADTINIAISGNYYGGCFRDTDMVGGYYAHCADTWDSETVYEEGDRVVNGGEYYTCILDMDAASETEPKDDITGESPHWMLDDYKINTLEMRYTYSRVGDGIYEPDAKPSVSITGITTNKTDNIYTAHNVMRHAVYDGDKLVLSNVSVYSSSDAVSPIGDPISGIYYARSDTATNGRIEISADAPSAATPSISVWSEDTSYYVGNRVMYDGAYYKCIHDITTTPAASRPNEDATNWEPEALLWISYTDAQDADFDTTDEYTVTITAYDGAVTIDGTEYYLSSLEQSVRVYSAIPVFDWGKNDFRFNVPCIATDITADNVAADVITLSGTAIKNIQYKDITLTGSTSVTTQDSGAGVYRSDAISPTAYSIAGKILSVAITGCGVLPGVIAPYVNGGNIYLMSAASCTVTDIVLTVTYDIGVS